METVFFVATLLAQLGEGFACQRAPKAGARWPSPLRALCVRTQVLNEKGLLRFSVDGRRRSRTLCFLYTRARAFLERDVAVQAQIGETLDQFAGAWPSHFHPIDFGTLADSEDHSRVVRR